MKTRLLVALIAFTALAVLFLGLPDAVRVAVKAIPCLGMAWFAWHGEGAQPVRLGVTIGLLFSVVGDVVLEVPDRPDLFVPGLLAFLLAHLAYVAAFVSAERRVRFEVLLIVLAWIQGIWRTFDDGLGDLYFPVAAYVGVISVMIWRAVAFGLRGGAAGVAAIGGCLLFGISDSLIAVNKFVGAVPAADLFILTTYWLGQAGITAAAALPTPGPGSPAPR